MINQLIFNDGTQYSSSFLFILVWWSRRNDNSPRECDVDFENENPSLEGKICGKEKSSFDLIMIKDKIFKFH